MSVVDQLSTESVRNWFKGNSDSEDEISEELSELPYQGVGYVLDLPGVNDFQLTIVHDNTDRQYASYGYQYLDMDEGYVVFSVTARDGSSANFKLPYGYASFEGWSWDVDKIARVEKREKVVTSWEWTNI